MIKGRGPPKVYDARQVLRALRHRPWYALSIIIVTALGFALLTSVFAVVDGVLFKPLGYPAEERLFAIQFSSTRDKRANAVSAEDLVNWAAAAPGAAFTGFLAQPYLDMNAALNATAVGHALVQPNFFDVIGVRPAVGGFTPEDFQPTSSRIEPRIVTADVFRSRFGGDPHVLGRTIVADPTNGFGYRIVGIMPRAFVFPSDKTTVGYLAPYRDRTPPRRDLPEVVARVSGGIGPQQVRVRVLALASTATGASIDRNDPTFDRVDVRPLGRVLGAGSRSLFEAILIATVLIVAVAALNASSLMSARALDRGQELAVRRALGATVIDLGRLLLLEALILIGAGAALGLAAATPLLRLGLHLLPEDLVLFRPAAIDGRVAVFAGLAGALLACVATIWPLRRATTKSAYGLAPGRSGTERARSAGWRLVVIVQVAAALVLTVAGALVVCSLLTVYAQTQAITTSGVITIEALFHGSGLVGVSGRVSTERAVRANAVLDRLRLLPGVESVAATAAELLDGGSSSPWFKVPATATRGRLNTDMQAVTADYYRVVRPHLVAGRLPTEAELALDAPVIVVSEGVARKYWPDTTALGQTLQDNGTNGKDGQTFTVVGVVKDVRWWSWDQETAQIYGPYALLARSPMPTFLIRTSASPGRVIQDALGAIGTVDPLLQPVRAAMLDDLFVDSVRPRRFRAWLFGSFAFASLVVAGIGIFGQLAMSIARRTREVGIRLACGATPVRIVRQLVTEQLGPVAIGLASGGLLAAWTVRFVKSYLYQLTAYDAHVWTAAIAVMLITAAIGTLLPALRASRIDPTVALREE
jgi:predicted permease